MDFFSDVGRGFRIKLSSCAWVKYSLFAYLLLFSIVFANRIQAATIRVPQDAATIQQGIDVAIYGDTVLVAPGTYYENIVFRSTAITVLSEQGPAVTIIDGRHLDSVFYFPFDAGLSTLSGFTIQNGRASQGGGIRILGSSPRIIGNVIANNRACSGAGIKFVASQGVIEGNEIRNNVQALCTGGAGGGGISVEGANGGAKIINNIISNNSMLESNGGGISIHGSTTLVIKDNVISGNVARNSGGGIEIAVETTDVLIVQNVIVGNSVLVNGGGVNWSAFGVRLINNTIVNNDALRGSGLSAGNYLGNTFIANNIIQGKEAQAAVYCEFVPINQNVFKFNNVFTPQGIAYGGICGNQTNINGNISASPLFVDAVSGDFRLRFDSPSIDAGNNTIAGVPPLDFDENPRVLDGDGSGEAVIDMGAYEFADLVANAGPDQTVAVATDCVATVRLDGRGSFDPDGDQLTFTWTGTFGTVSGSTASVSLPKGQHIITLTVTDSNGNTATDTVVITVVDSIPPIIADATATPNVLLQANHQMVPISVSTSVSDNCDVAAVCQIISVTSNEPVEGLGDGDTSPDWEITGNLTVDLRAERSAHGTGRLYTITVQCSDLSGNLSTRTVTVNVPRNN